MSTRTRNSEQDTSDTEQDRFTSSSARHHICNHLKLDPLQSDGTYPLCTDRFVLPCWLLCKSPKAQLVVAVTVAHNTNIRTIQPRPTAKNSLMHLRKEAEETVAGGQVALYTVQVQSAQVWCLVCC